MTWSTMTISIVFSTLMLAWSIVLLIQSRKDGRLSADEMVRVRMRRIVISAIFMVLALVNVIVILATDLGRS